MRTLDSLSWVLAGVFCMLVFSSYHLSMAAGMSPEVAAHFGPSFIAALHGSITSVLGTIYMLSSQFKIRGLV